MRRTEKDAFVDELQEKLSGASAFYLTDFTGLSVKQITQLRVRLRSLGQERDVGTVRGGALGDGEADAPAAAAHEDGAAGKRRRRPRCDARHGSQCTG